jgi:hypothetical protein
MARWRNKAIVNLLEHSKEKNDHSIAAKEWVFSGEVIDHLVSNQFCQLCEGENLRYHFEIKNKSRNNKLLLVGSSCIKKFDIAVFDEKGKEIFGSQKSSFLQKKIDQKKQELMMEQIRSLLKVANHGERDTIEYYVYEHKNKNGFSPNDLYDLFSLMEKYKNEFTKVLFKVSLRSQFELNRLINMPELKREIILPCLTVAQKKRFSARKKQLKLEQETKVSITEKPHIPTTSVYTHDIFDTVNIHHRLEQPNFNRQPKPEKKKQEHFHLPEYAKCSICGEYKRWVCFNPNKCKECLEKSHNKK